MAKLIDLSSCQPGQLSKVAKALSSEARIQIICELYNTSLNINEIAEKLSIPPSSAAMHIKVLEEAGLINTKQLPGERGTMKLCSRSCDQITIRLMDDTPLQSTVSNISMPIGAYTDCSVQPTCGIGTATQLLIEDNINAFYIPERMDAQILWTSAGYVEYKFPDIIPFEQIPSRITLIMEICSEVANYREDWKSDITLWINGISCGAWRSPGDFGKRRGRLSPDWNVEGRTQYGLLTKWSVNSEGCFINMDKVSDVTIEDLALKSLPYITVRLGNDPTSEYIGGFNLFGAKCGDYAQDIVMSIEF
jgi:predicted transcriptional regulator